MAGAALDTQNLGVSALAYGTIRALDSCDGVAKVTVFDYGRGVMPLVLKGESLRVSLQRCGLFSTRRYYRPESFGRVRIENAIGVPVSATTKVLRGLDAVLDLSGGDSFSDIYGVHRFQSVVAMKWLSLDFGLPLVLMPQTYGPFSTPDVRREASRLCRLASVASARDRASFERLKELLGSSFDPARHFAGVDMAFAMEPERPSKEVSETLQQWRTQSGTSPIVGLNVSGLVYGLADGGVSGFGFKSNYREMIYELCCTLVRDHDVRIGLVPHVLGDSGHDADPPANRALLECLPHDVASKMIELTPDSNPAQAKGLISEFDWFCGTRMHATIAALSTGTPVASIVYSDKAAGVFETCLMGDHAIDPRVWDGPEIICRVVASFTKRDNVRPALRTTANGMANKVLMQTSRIVEILQKDALLNAD